MPVQTVRSAPFAPDPDMPKEEADIAAYAAAIADLKQKLAVELGVLVEQGKTTDEAAQVTVGTVSWVGTPGEIHSAVVQGSIEY